MVDEDHSDFSQRIAAGLAKEGSLKVQATSGARDGNVPLTRAAAEALVKNGDVPVAVVIPAGIGAAFGSRGFGGGGPAIQLLADVSTDRRRWSTGCCEGDDDRRPDLLMRRLQQFEQHAGALTAEQRVAVDAWLPRLRQNAAGAGSSSAAGAMPMGIG